MRSYDITAGIPALWCTWCAARDSEKGSDAGDGSNEAAMWDDFEYTASNGPLSAYWGQNYKIIYQCNEILDDIEEERTQGRHRSHPQPRRSALLPCLVLLQPGTRLWRSAAGHHQGSGSLRCQRAQDHGGKDIRTD